ncbi:hypothetical protein LVB00_27615, partial [Klebsiella pneumoniae]|nr:hypothetical protein [Klebsiella pneumoniae]
ISPCPVVRGLDGPGPAPAGAAQAGGDRADFTAPHPTLTAGIPDYCADGRTPDDLFDDCLRVVIAGAAASN